MDECELLGKIHDSLLDRIYKDIEGNPVEMARASFVLQNLAEGFAIGLVKGIRKTKKENEDGLS